MDKVPPEGAVKVVEESTLTGYFFRIFFWIAGKWKELWSMRLQREKS